MWLSRNANKRFIRDLKDFDKVARQGCLCLCLLDIQLCRREPETESALSNRKTINAPRRRLDSNCAPANKMRQSIRMRMRCRSGSGSSSDERERPFEKGERGEGERTTTKERIPKGKSAPISLQLIRIRKTMKR